MADTFEQSHESAFSQDSRFTSFKGLQSDAGVFDNSTNRYYIAPSHLPFQSALEFLDAFDAKFDLYDTDHSGRVSLFELQQYNQRSDKNDPVAGFVSAEATERYTELMDFERHLPRLATQPRDLIPSVYDMNLPDRSGLSRDSIKLAKDILAGRPEQYIGDLQHRTMVDGLVNFINGELLTIVAVSLPEIPIVSVSLFSLAAFSAVCAGQDVAEWILATDLVKKQFSLDRKEMASWSEFR